MDEETHVSLRQFLNGVCRASRRLDVLTDVLWSNEEKEQMNTKHKVMAAFFEAALLEEHVNVGVLIVPLLRLYLPDKLVLRANDMHRLVIFTSFFQRIDISPFEAFVRGVDNIDTCETLADVCYVCLLDVLRESQ